MYYIFVFICFSVAWPVSLQNEPNYLVTLGDFVSLPGGRGNIAEFGKALRLPSFSEQNLVQFHKYGDWFSHRFVFANTSRVLEFRFKFGETHQMNIHGKVIEYMYEYEPTANADAATIFARYTEIGGDMRFTVEAVFSRTGMTTTYTHADVLDNIMARRRYKRVFPKEVLGYYELVEGSQSDNFEQFAKILPLPKNSSYSPNNKLYLHESGSEFLLEEFLEPETRILRYSFAIGEKRTAFIEGKVLQYVYHVHQVENNTVWIGKFATNDGSSYQIHGTFSGHFLNLTYKGNDVVASRSYKRALPLGIYGTYEVNSSRVVNYTEFSTIFVDNSIEPLDSGSQLKLYRKNSTFYFELQKTSAFGGSLIIPFQLGEPVQREFGGKTFSIIFTYTTKENTILHMVVTDSAGSLSYKVDYHIDATGMKADYRRETSTDPVTASRVLRRLLPQIIYGRYETIAKSPGFDEFADSIHYPELKRKIFTDYVYDANNHYYIQKFQYGVGDSLFTNVTFLVGEVGEQLVKNTWWMSYTYIAYEGERISLRSRFYEKPNQLNAPKWEEFTRVGDYTPEGYTSVYYCGNRTEWRIYKRISNGTADTTSK